jgi:ABC-type branched-subunit amino acid transport system ATPase component
MSVLDNPGMGAYTRRAVAKARRDLCWISKFFPVLVELRQRAPGAC